MNTVLEKSEFISNMILSASLLTRLKCRPYLKYLQTSVIIGDGMNLCHKSMSVRLV